MCLARQEALLTRNGRRDPKADEAELQPRMTLDQLRIFVAVAEREHVTRAAAELHLTQSAVSAAVAALESRYASRLFDRIGRRIALTDAGRQFLVEAKAVLARAAAAETVLSDLAGLKKGRLALAASQTVASYWLPPAMHRFQMSYPGVSLSLSIANTEMVAAMIHDGSADIGVVEGDVDDPSLAASVVADDEMVLVVSPDHPWASRTPARSLDLSASSWVLREHGSGTRAILETAFEDAGLHPAAIRCALELPSNEAVRAAVEAGAGASVMSRLVAQGSIDSGRLVEAAYPLPMRRFWALTHKERYATKAATAFLEVMTAGEALPLAPELVS